MAEPFPIERFLVPESVAGPVGFTKVDQQLVAGLPATIDLGDGLSLVLSLATGLVNTWRDADPHQVVTQSFDQTITLPTGPRQEIGATGRMPARLALVRGGDVLGSLPLVAGLRRRLPACGEVAIDLIVLRWEIRAGSLRGAGDFGSAISFVWRRADRGADSFLPPPVDPMILARIHERSRGASELGARSKRLPAGYGPPESPAPSSNDDDVEIEVLLLDEYEYAQGYYTTYDVP